MMGIVLTDISIVYIDEYGDLYEQKVIDHFRRYSSFSDIGNLSRWNITSYIEIRHAHMLISFMHENRSNVKHETLFEQVVADEYMLSYLIKY